MTTLSRKNGLKWAFYGSSLVSAYRNGAATYYRGIIRSLAARGHDVTFYEPDAIDRQKNSDIPDPAWARIHVYENNHAGMARALELGKDADIIVKCSGAGVFDPELEAAALGLKNTHNRIIFWDVDAPATLARMAGNPNDPFRALVSRYDLIFTCGGGQPVVDKYKQFNARACIPIYNALDRTTHFRVNPDSKYKGALGFLGNRLPDREKRVDDFFLNAVSQMPKDSFILGGNGWGDKPLPDNVRYLGHVFTHEHNAFNSSVTAVLNLSRNSRAAVGFSPATRMFEAAGAGACVISDAWEGIELFLEPGKEVLVAYNGDDVADQVRRLRDRRAREIGEAAHRRICAQHTYEQRALQVDTVLKNAS